MAIYHLSVKAVKRSAGRSATAAAAYRSGELVHDERTGETHDYRRRSGVLHTELVGWASSRAQLWNAAETAERRKDACVAREYEIALPAELESGAQVELARQFGRWLRERHGVAVDICVHQGHGDARNVHAHILASTRPVEADGGLSEIKAQIEWSDKKRRAHGLPGRKTELAAAREAWEVMANAALERAGQAARIDCRSLAAQGIEREPEPKMGPAATAMERRGEATERGQLRAEVIDLNEVRARRAREREAARAELERVERELGQLQAELDAQDERLAALIEERAHFDTQVQRVIGLLDELRELRPAAIAAGRVEDPTRAGQAAARRRVLEASPDFYNARRRRAAAKAALGETRDRVADERLVVAGMGWVELHLTPEGWRRRRSLVQALRDEKRAQRGAQRAERRFKAASERVDMPSVRAARKRAEAAARRRNELQAAALEREHEHYLQARRGLDVRIGRAAQILREASQRLNEHHASDGHERQAQREPPSPAPAPPRGPGFER